MNTTYDNPLFLIPLVSGVIFIITGIVTLVFPPKKINALYGYRTNSSMKSQARWDFAQKYAAIAMCKMGILLALSCFMGLVFIPKSKIGMLMGLGFMILMLILFFIRVEKAIGKKFNNEN